MYIIILNKSLVVTFDGFCFGVWRVLDESL